MHQMLDRREAKVIQRSVTWMSGSCDLFHPCHRVPEVPVEPWINPSSGQDPFQIVHHPFELWGLREETRTGEDHPEQKGGPLGRGRPLIRRSVGTDPIPIGPGVL